MTRPVSARAWIYAVAVVVAPFAALALGDPAPVLVALPPAVLLVVGLLADPGDSPELELRLGDDRILQGGTVSLQVAVRARAAVAHVRLGIPPDVDVVEVAGGRVVDVDGLEVTLHAGEGEAEVVLRPRQWGTFDLGPAAATVAGPLRMGFRRSHDGPSQRLVVLPELEKTRRLIEPLRTNMHAGDVMSTDRGPGVELAELRRWAPGDSRRMINWRATARSEDVWVTDRHADRNGDLVLVVDAVAPPGSTLEGAVRTVAEIAATMVEGYGSARHRLGLVSLGGQVGWFGLASGRVHEHRLLAVLLDVAAARPPVWMAVDRILDRSVKAPSMVVFVSPLLDEGVVGRIHRLSRAGMDVAVLAVDASAWLEPKGNRVYDLARRIWMMERRRTIDDIRATGTAVVEWRSGRSVSELMEEVDVWRRRRRRARV